MILSTFLDDLAIAKNEEDSRKDLPIVLICGTVNEAPADAIEFRSLESVDDLLDEHPANCCYMVSAERSRYIEMVDAYPDCWSFQLVALTGVPGCDYSAEFERAVYRLARAPFHSVVNNLTEDARIAELAVAEQANLSIYGREQARITRRSGNVKEMRAFDAPNMALDTAETDDTPDTGEQ